MKKSLYVCFIISLGMSALQSQAYAELTFLRVPGMAIYPGFLHLTGNAKTLEEAKGSINSLGEGGKQDRTVTVRLQHSPRWEALDAPIFAVSEPSSAAGSIYVGTKRGLFMSEDAGHSWTPLAIGRKASEPIYAVTGSPEHSKTLFAGTQEGLWKTDDGGKTWASLQGNLPDGLVPRAIAICEDSPDTIYLGTEQHGVYRSYDGGTGWFEANAGLPQARAGGRPVAVKSLHAHPSNKAVAYLGTELSQIYRTTDGGETWIHLTTGLPQLIMRRTDPPRFATSPDEKTVYAAVSIPEYTGVVRTALYQSTNGGTSWQVIEGVALPKNLTVLSLQVDPSNQELLIKGSQGTFKVQTKNFTPSK